jgi:hypothetical protein
MADIASELASKCGIRPDVAKKGLGIVLEFLKNKLPAETYSKISATVPGADNMISAAADMGEGAGGGMLEAVKGAIGKLFGGGAGALLGKFDKLGMSPDQIQGFVSKLTEHFKGKLPENVMSQIRKLLPVPELAAH